MPAYARLVRFRLDVHEPDAAHGVDVTARAQPAEYNRTKLRDFTAIEIDREEVYAAGLCEIDALATLIQKTETGPDLEGPSLFPPGSP